MEEKDANKKEEIEEGRRKRSKKEKEVMLLTWINGYRIQHVYFCKAPMKRDAKK